MQSLPVDIVSLDTVLKTNLVNVNTSVKGCRVSVLTKLYEHATSVASYKFPFDKQVAKWQQISGTMYLYKKNSTIFSKWNISSCYLGISISLALSDVQELFKIYTGIPMRTLSGNVYQSLLN